jgi:RNA polymerase sigma-70 factor (ECF subfamily)
MEWVAWAASAIVLEAGLAGPCTDVGELSGRLVHLLGVTDAELVHAARSGSSEALGTLLARHRPAAYATAVSLLGCGDRAQDAVQDACLIAMRRLSELREPAAFGPWLRAIARSACLMSLRRPRPEPLGDDLPVADHELEPREWVWGAVNALPEEQRLTILLRYFGRECSYEEIARLCDVPVGTVRSRLSAARRALAARLLDDATPDAPDRSRAWHERLADAIGGLNDGRAAPLATLFADDAAIDAGRMTCGPRALVPALLEDREAGVIVHVDSVVAGAGVFVLDGFLDGPPGHCPPSFTWVARHDRGRITRLRFHHPCA